MRIDAAKRLAAVLALLSACGPTASTDGDAADAEADTSQDEGESETGEPTALGDSCETTELIIEAPATLRASLRHATASPLTEVCGVAGPAVFARVRVGGRVDLTMSARGRAFEPSLTVMPPDCLSVADDPGRLLACGHALPLTLFDIGPDIELLVAIAIAADDPALALTPAADGETDPLDVELAFTLQAVLGEGQRCGPGQGRCESGTVCLPADEDGVSVDRCRRPEADSCVAPGSWQLPPPGEVLSFTIAPDEPHSDAHEHACTGWRRPERVDRLELPASLPAGTTLIVRADDPRVGLALRGPSCAVEHALACAADGAPSETVLSWGGDGSLADMAAAGDSPWLFIELPRQDRGDQGGDELGPIDIEVELVAP